VELAQKSNQCHNDFLTLCKLHVIQQHPDKQTLLTLKMYLSNATGQSQLMGLIHHQMENGGQLGLCRKLKVASSSFGKPRELNCE